MANSPQAEKRGRQAEKRRAHNAGQRSEMRTYIKGVIKAVQAKDLALAKSTYQAAVSTLDKLACRGLIHKNKAARHKSRLNKLLQSSAS